MTPGTSNKAATAAASSEGSPERAPLLEIEELTVEFATGRRRAPLRAVDNVQLSIAPGETLGLVGESGSGKSTLALAVLGLVEPTVGTIRFEGHDLSTLGRAERRGLSRQLQVIFQDPYSSLNPARTVGQSLIEPLEVHERLSRDDKQRRVQAILARVGLPHEAANRYPAQFSGGQLQRIAIARALIVSPRLVICDEAVSALDLSVQAQILNLLGELQKDLSLSYLFISHDLAVVRHLSSRIVVMYGGRVMETGTAESVYSHAGHPYTQSLLAAEPTLNLSHSSTRRSMKRGATAAAPARLANGCPYAGRCAFEIDRCRRERPALRRSSAGTLAACHVVSEAQAPVADRSKPEPPPN